MFFLKLFSFLFFINILATDALAISQKKLLQEAQTLEGNGFLEDATKSWKELAIVSSEPNFVIYAQLKLGIIYLKLKQFQKSIQISKTTAMSHSDNFDANFTLANSLSAFKNFSEAIKFYKKTIILKPKEGLSYVGLGLSLFGNGNSESAIKALLKAKKLFKEKKNISWHRDARVMISQIKHFAKFPPHFSNLWVANNLKLVHDTYEKAVFNPKQYLSSIYINKKKDFQIKTKQ